MKRRRLTRSERGEVYSKYGGRCCYCGCEIVMDEMNADHVVSLHNHGADELGNIVPACHDCNYYKSGSNPDGFKKKLKKAFRKEQKCDFVKGLEEKYSGWEEKFYFERN